MTEPVFSVTTETLYERLPDAYRNEDAQQLIPIALPELKAATNFVRNPRFKDTNNATVLRATNLITNPRVHGLGGYLTGHSAGLTEVVDLDGTHWARKPPSNGSADWMYATFAGAKKGHYYAARLTVRGTPGETVYMGSTDNVLGGPFDAASVVLGADGRGELVASSSPAYVNRGTTINFGPTSAGQLDITHAAVFEVSGTNMPPPDYFDGSIADDAFTYDWVGTVDASASTKTAKVPTHYLNQTPEAARNLVTNPSFEVDANGYVTTTTLTRDTSWAAVGTASLRMDPSGGNSDSYAGVGGDAGAIQLGLTPGKTYTASGVVNTPAAQTGTLSTRARKICAFTKVGAAAYVETASAAGPVTGQARVSVTFTVPANATEAFIRIYNGSGVTGEIVQWDALMVTEGTTLLDYFDGDFGSDDSYTFAWTGTANASASAKTGRTPFFISNEVSPVTGSPATKVLTRGQFAGSLVGLYYDPIATPAIEGSTWGVQVKLKGPAGKVVYMTTEVSPWIGSHEHYVGFTLTGEWQTCTVLCPLPVPAGSTVYFIVLSNENMDYLVADAMIFTGTEAPDYFDGSTDDYAHRAEYVTDPWSWAGTPHDSLSLQAARDSSPAGYPMKRWLSGVIDQAGDVEDFLNRATITTPDDGGSADDRSDLADPQTADEAWLPWIAQMLGKKINPSLSTQQARDYLTTAGYKSGTKQAIAEAAGSVLVGTKSVQVYDHTTDSSARGAGGAWDVLLVTKASETLENLAPEATATTASPSAFSDADSPAGSTKIEIVEETGLGLYMDRVVKFSASASGNYYWGTFTTAGVSTWIPVTAGDTDILIFNYRANRDLGSRAVEVAFFTAAGGYISSMTPTVTLDTTLRKFSYSFTVPATATAMIFRFNAVPLVAGDWVEMAQIAVRRGANDIWVPRTADPIGAVIKAGAKPAGIKLWTRTAEASWNAIEAANTTWNTWDTRTWTQIEETGM